MNPTFSLPNLLSQEDNDSSSIKIPQPRSEDDHYIQSLIQKETQSNNYASVSADDDSKTRFKCARFDTINWIFTIREILGFSFSTVYLSLTYFDRFNSRRVIDIGKEWAFQLLGIACLSLAAKMEEQNVPSLSQYKQQGYYNFESSVIQRMELLVLTTLEWRMCGITPFAYLHYFLSKICGESDWDEVLVSKASGFVLDFSKEVNLMDHRPSVVAIAAVLLACDDQLTRSKLECKIGVVSSLHSLEKECIYHCYNLLKEVETKKNNTPELNSFDSLRNHWSDSSNIGIKRKLTYNGFEQKCPLRKSSRRS